MERAAQATPTPATIANTWENSLANIDVLRATPGQATLTVTLIGHPADISTQASYMDLTFPPITIPPLPKGIPMPPRTARAAPPRRGAKSPARSTTQQRWRLSKERPAPMGITAKPAKEPRTTTPRPG